MRLSDIPNPEQTKKENVKPLIKNRIQTNYSWGGERKPKHFACTMSNGRASTRPMVGILNMHVKFMKMELSYKNGIY